MNLLNLLSSSSSSGTGQQANNNWIIWVILAVFVVIMIVPSFFRSKREKKAYEEKMAQMRVGAKVRTIGLIVGEIMSMTEDTVTLKTGDDENYSYITVEKRAIYEIIPEPVEDDETADAESIDEPQSQDPYSDDNTAQAEDVAEAGESSQNEEADN